MQCTHIIHMHYIDITYITHKRHTHTHCAQTPHKGRSGSALSLLPDTGDSGETADAVKAVPLGPGDSTIKWLIVATINDQPQLPGWHLREASRSAARSAARFAARLAAHRAPHPAARSAACSAAHSEPVAARSAGPLGGPLFGVSCAC